MATVHYRKRLSEYLDTLPQEALITTGAVTAYIAEKTGEPEEKVRKATEYYMQNAKEGSIAAKANMVKYYNDRSAKA